ncbi:hypothetical protein BOX37_28325 [Nocardia mangyaensis]|uniref:TrbL/VirB6 plasmid conjugal transfer protein n=1 Tax=Nocardia mangyaensis TaxID=2213200 RepID=A0A1J0VYM8_9NOCA|nr:hypothetical protein [Nocardia mangyaensis]APE37192.1 hypothetical protein BOX37_28325 [Nocardia mangyaensis]
MKEVCQLGSAAVNAAGDSVIDSIVADLVESLVSALRMVMAWWTTFPSPELTTSQGQPAPVLAQIREYTSGLQVVLLTAGIIFAAARLALAKRGAAAGEAQESFLMLARATFGAMTFGVLITVATTAGDEFADWVVFDAARGDLDTAVGRIADQRITVNLGPGILLVLTVLGLISMLVQLVMLVVRQALLVVVVAVIPMAAAASGTGPGSQAYKRLVAWSLAFVLWKPVGALVYAIAFTVTGSGDEPDPQMILLGVILMVMSVIVLPALIRLIAPAVATLGGGGGAASALAGAGAGIAMSAVGSGGSQARKMSEAENSGSSAGSSSRAGSTPSGPSGAGGARPMAASSGTTSGGTGSAPGGGGSMSAGAVGGGARAGGASAAGAGGSSGAAAAGAMGAGPAGAAMLGAQLTVGALQGISAAAQSSIPESSPMDPDALGPGEVRR